MNRLTLQRVFERLLDHFGPQQWWPAQTPYEVLVGAILTQNTAWTNVERAIANLDQAGALDPQRLVQLTPAELEGLIRPSGFYRQKAARLLAITHLLCESYAGDIARMCAGPLEEVRDRLLELRGIGPETADAILLYAADRPSFVVDAYTRRLFSRLGLLQGDESYTSIRRSFMEQLPPDVSLFNEYHALIVAACKDYCRKRAPQCDSCPLQTNCPSAGTI